MSECISIYIKFEYNFLYIKRGRVALPRNVVLFSNLDLDFE